MNSVTLIGNLTSDPKLTYTPNTNTPVTSFRLAVSRMGKDAGADFIQCKVFGKQAESLPRYKFSGDELAVHGRIETGSYKKKDGTTAYTTEVICDYVEFTRGSKQRSQEHPQEQYQEQYQEQPQQRFTPVPDYRPQEPKIDWDIPDNFQAAEDDIPF